jgi:cobalt-zinc-cadmium efflux system outer membrane protein
MVLCIVPLGLQAENHQGIPGDTGHPEQPSSHDTSGQQTPRRMPGTAMPNPQNVPLYENRQIEQPQNPGQRGDSERPIPELLADLAHRPAMTLKDFEDLAEANNPALMQAKQLMQRSTGQARQAGLYPNPLIGYQGEEIRGGSFGGGEHGAFVQQTIVLGGKLGLRRRVLEEQRREDEFGVAEQRSRLLNDVTEGFYSALAAQETVSLRRNLLKIANDAVETAHQLANVGQADAPDVLQAEVEAEQANVEYAAAERNFIQVFNTLAAVAGKPDLPLSPLKGGLEDWPKLDPERILETIVRDSPSVMRAQAGVAQAEVKLSSARRESVPDLQLRAGISKDNELLNEASFIRTPVGIVGFATVGVNIPIFNRNQGNVAAAKAELETAQEEVTRVQLSLRRSAEPLLEAYLAEQFEADRFKNEMVPKATRAYQLYLDKYRQIGSAYPQVIVSQRTLVQLEVGYIRALENLWRNATALQNFTLSGGLEAPKASGISSTATNLPTSGGGGME